MGESETQLETPTKQDAVTAGSRNLLKVGWQKAKAGVVRAWEWLHPGPRAREGAGRGLMVAAYGLGIAVGTGMSIGLHPLLDPVLGFLIGVLSVRLAGRLTLLASALIQDLPRFIDRRGLAAMGGLVTIFFLIGLKDLLIPWGLGIAISAAFLGGSLALMSGGWWPELHPAKKAAAGTFFLLTSAGFLFILYWLVHEGDDAHLEQRPVIRLHQRAEHPRITPLAVADPSQNGPYRVRSLTYGSGTDKRRPEFGAEVDLRTESVDLTPFVKGNSGWRITARHRFWGFDFEKTPLNGRVWYPDGAGPFPLVLIVHGNHNMADLSDPGYAYFGEHLASRGFILVSIDQNFVNGSIFGGLRRENDGRGWLLLQHLAAWRQFNQQPDNPFFNHADLSRVALIGHSRGGEAAAIAGSFNRLPYYPDDATVTFDFNFGIRAVVAIAPSDGQYKPADRPTPLENVDYLVLQGGHDADVSVFAGARQFQRVTFDDGDYHFKASVYAYRANHGQFNTVWGAYDFPWPRSRFLNIAPLLSGEEQRQIGRLYITAFLEASLHGQDDYLPFFRDPRALAHLLPDDAYITRFEDSTFEPLADYEEDIDVTSASWEGVRIQGTNLALWREEALDFRQGGNKENQIAVVGWRDDRAGQTDAESGVASYALSLPMDLQFTENQILSIALADADLEPPQSESDEGEGEEAEQPDNELESENSEESDEAERRQRPSIDFHIELVARDGVTARLPLSHFDVLSLPLESRFTKLKDESDGYGKAWEPTLQTFELPLREFLSIEPGLDPTSLETIRLVFDLTEEGVVMIDDIGYWTPMSTLEAPAESR